MAQEKSENKERLAAFELFKEWLMEQRKDMAQEIINLTDTDAPLMPGVNNNTDAPLYDVYGRSYFLMLSTRIFGG